MFLGAAFTYGQGNSYGDTYANLISDYLKTKGITKSINAAVPAQLPNRQLCWFIQEGYKYKPEIICIEIYDKEDFNNLKFDLKESDIFKFLIDKDYKLIWSGVFSHIFRR